MASAQPLATPACKADLWFQQQGKGAQAGQAGQVEQGGSAPTKRACGHLPAGNKGASVTVS